MIRISYAKYTKEMKEAIIARMWEGDEMVTDIQRDTRVMLSLFATESIVVIIISVGIYWIKSSYCK